MAVYSSDRAVSETTVAGGHGDLGYSRSGERVGGCDSIARENNG